MLRVLTLSTLFPDASRPVFGGFVERQTISLAAHKDVQLEVVAPIGVAPWPLNYHTKYRGLAEVPEQEVWKDTIVHRPRFPVIPKIGGRFMPSSIADKLKPLLLKIRERFPFDVIDAEFFYPDGPAAMRLAQALNVPFSIKSRGSDIHVWGQKPGCREQVKQAGNKASGLLAVSQALKSDMIAMGMDSDKIAVHYTGIDRERFKPVDRVAAKADLGLTGHLIVTVGALIQRKGQQFVVDALTDIPDTTLVLIGEGDNRSALEKQVARLGLGDRVQIPGNMPHNEVAKLVAAADIMTLPSVSEGLANAWVEALASGTPIVITDVGGAPELMDRPEAGALVPRNSEAIGDAIRQILANPPDQDAVAATVDRFSWERNTETLFAHLAGLVEGQ